GAQVVEAEIERLFHSRVFPQVFPEPEAEHAAVGIIDDLSAVPLIQLRERSASENTEVEDGITDLALCCRGQHERERSEKNQHGLPKSPKKTRRCFPLFFSFSKLPPLPPGIVAFPPPRLGNIATSRSGWLGEISNAAGYSPSPPRSSRGRQCSP